MVRNLFTKLPLVTAGVALFTLMPAYARVVEPQPAQGQPNKNHLQYPREQSTYYQDKLKQMSLQSNNEVVDLLTNFERNDARPNYNQAFAYVFEIGSTHGARVLLIKDERTNPSCKYKSPPNTYNVVGMYQATGNSTVDHFAAQGFVVNYDPWNYGPVEPKWPQGCNVDTGVNSPDTPFPIP